MERIHVAGPWITEREIAYVTDAVTHAWYDRCNEYVDRFENSFADYLGRRYTMALPSCTSAIHLSLAALGVGPGDEVIVPEITWIASAAPITYVGATPVFADIDPRTWCLSASSLEEWITPRTKAVIPVDLYGNVPDMDAILAIARHYGIAVIEDAAEAIGATYGGKRAGSFGDTGVFSFHGSKTLTTGEGGMLVTDESTVYERASFLRDHGRQSGDKLFFNAEVAYKYKMSSLQAALGLAQLERVGELVDRKRQIFDWYRSALRDIDGVALNYEASNVKNAFWMVTVVLDPALKVTKQCVIQQMAARGIDCRPFFYPLSSLPAFERYGHMGRCRERNRNSYQISPFGVNLPSALNLTEDDVSRVSDALRTVLRR